MHGLQKAYDTFIERAKSSAGIQVPKGQDIDIEEVRNQAGPLLDRLRVVAERHLYLMGEDDQKQLSKDTEVRPYFTRAMAPILLSPILHEDEQEVSISMGIPSEDLKDLAIVPLTPIGALDLALRLLKSVASVEELYARHTDHEGNVDFIAMQSENVDMIMSKVSHDVVAFVNNEDTKTTHTIFCCSDGLSNAKKRIQEILDGKDD